MKLHGYQIGLYDVGQVSEAVELLGENLWAANYERNGAYFRWKYHHNPYATQPMAVVAIYEGHIVGFRGYFATNWYVGSVANKTAILVPGDTVVRSDHRRRGLSVAMGNLAMERFASRYRILLNTTTGKNSTPGYLRMGFVPLRKKAHYRRSTLAWDVKIIAKNVQGKATVLRGRLVLGGPRHSRYGQLALQANLPGRRIGSHHKLFSEDWFSCEGQAVVRCLLSKCGSVCSEIVCIRD